MTTTVTDVIIQLNAPVTSDVSYTRANVERLRVFLVSRLLHNSTRPLFECVRLQVL